MVAELAQQLKKLGIGVRTILYANNDHEILSEISASEYVIALRFHATVLGLAAGCKVLPLLYSNKTRHVFEDLEYPITSCVDLLDTSDTVFEHEVVSGNVFPVAETIRKSYCQFQAFDKWLEQYTPCTR